MFERVRDIIGDKEINGEIKAIIAPHAGYMYSGQTAAIAYSFVRGKVSVFEGRERKEIKL